MVSQLPCYWAIYYLDEEYRVMIPEPWLRSAAGRRLAEYRTLALVRSSLPTGTDVRPRLLVTTPEGEQLLTGKVLQWSVWYRDAPVYGRLAFVRLQRRPSVRIAELPWATRLPTRTEISRTYDGLSLVLHQSKGGAPAGLRYFNSPEECREAIVRAIEGLYRKGVKPRLSLIAELLPYQTTARTLNRWCAYYHWNPAELKAEAYRRARS